MSVSEIALYWIPLGAGGHSVRLNGRVYEAAAAAYRHRSRCDLYHAALVVELDGDRHTIELAPSPDGDEARRGVVATGAVGLRRLGRLRSFRYEIRCWRGGSIPDLADALGGPNRLSTDPRVARRLLDAAPAVPTPVWGRDELKAGEGWNSNSVIAWLIATAGLPAGRLQPPPHGRAPGWRAGVEVARRRGDRGRDGGGPWLGSCACPHRATHAQLGRCRPSGPPSVRCAVTPRRSPRRQAHPTRSPTPWRWPCRRPSPMR